MIRELLNKYRNKYIQSNKDEHSELRDAVVTQVKSVRLSLSEIHSIWARIAPEGNCNEV